MQSESEQIHELGYKFLIPLSLEETYVKIVEEAKKLINGEFGSVFLSQDGKNLTRVYTSSPLMKAISPRKRGTSYNAFRKNSPVIKTKESLQKSHPEYKKINIKSALYIPLWNRGKPVGLLIMYTKKNKNELEQDLENLTKFIPVASLAIRKAQLYQELYKEIETRDLFISLAAHEFRTPLTTIDGYIQLMKKRVKDSDPEKEWLDLMAGEAMRLKMLINELLETNKVHKEFEYRFGSADLNEILKKSIKSFEFIHPQRICKYENSQKKECHIIGDPDKLLQVFTNLLDNAAKFSSPDSRISLTLLPKNSSFEVMVVDHGKGIDKEEMKKIFNEFYKGDDTYPGMGLGLFLANKIIKKHKGSIRVKSSMKNGTTVSVTLPKEDL